MRKLNKPLLIAAFAAIMLINHSTNGQDTANEQQKQIRHANAQLRLQLTVVEVEQQALYDKGVNPLATDGKFPTPEMLLKCIEEGNAQVIATIQGVSKNNEEARSNTRYDWHPQETESSKARRPRGNKIDRMENLIFRPSIQVNGNIDVSLEYQLNTELFSSEEDSAFGQLFINYNSRVSLNKPQPIIIMSKQIKDTQFFVVAGHELISLE